jgi:hypothetical protein
MDMVCVADFARLTKRRVTWEKAIGKNLWCVMRDRGFRSHRD